MPLMGRTGANRVVPILAQQLDQKVLFRRGASCGKGRTPPPTQASVDAEWPGSLHTTQTDMDAVRAAHPAKVHSLRRSGRKRQQAGLVQRLAPDGAELVLVH
jgi:hypothetical protein